MTVSLREFFAFAVIVGCATVLTMLVGPYWFLLILGVLVGWWIVISCLVVAGRADRDLERMRWEHTKNRGEPPRGGRDTAA